MNGKCPFCGAKVSVSNARKVGEIITCSECDVELEIIRTNPLELDWPLDDYDEYDDYDDDDYDDDEDDDEDYEDEDY